MIIPTISTHLYQVRRNKQRMLLEAERRRAVKLLAGIALCIALIVLLWVR